MYPQYQPIPFRSAPIGPIGNSRFIPFFGFPFLAGLAGGIIGGALAFGPRPFYPPYPPPPFPCYGSPCPTPYFY
ncbi:hypothetical protein V7024_17215 [Bacillus sp. JJ864]|uniref:hypothetical protein n=1 Tax=Bacillus sp. JJ864 TaxID=3122975 RepID=UPI002FFEAEBF